MDVIYTEQMIKNIIGNAPPSATHFLLDESGFTYIKEINGSLFGLIYGKGFVKTITRDGCEKNLNQFHLSDIMRRSKKNATC